MTTWFDKLPRPEYSSLERVLTSEPWFEVYAIRPSVFAIYEPYQFQEVISYLIVGSEKSLLIDTGMGIGNMAKVVNELSSRPLLVINTHTHFDHIGDNWRFEQSLLGVRCEFSAKDYDELTSDAQADAQDGSIRLEHAPNDFNRETYRIKPYCISKYISDGEVLNLGGDRKIIIYFTPGHTPDSLCLLDVQERLLFVGDTFYRGPVYLLRPETNLDDYMKSLERLIDVIKDHHVEFIIPAHNIPIVDPSLLTIALEGMKSITQGKIIGKKTTEHSYTEYPFEKFSFLVNH